MDPQMKLWLIYLLFSALNPSVYGLSEVVNDPVEVVTDPVEVDYLLSRDTVQCKDPSFELIGQGTTYLDTTWITDDEDILQTCIVTVLEHGSSEGPGILRCEDEFSLSPRSVQDGGERTQHYKRIGSLHPCTTYELTLGIFPPFDDDPFSTQYYYYGEIPSAETNIDYSVAPTDLACDITTVGEVRITWSPPLPGCYINDNTIYTVQWTEQSEWSNFSASNETTTDEFSLKLDSLPCTDYKFDVTAEYLDFNTSSSSASIRCVTLPEASSPPRNVSIVGVTSSTMTVAWEEPLQANGIIDFYEIFVQELNMIFNSTNLQYKIENLLPCSDYTVTVSARNGYNGTGQPSEPLHGTTPDDLDEPTIEVICSANNETIMVQWNSVTTNCSASTYNLTYIITPLWGDITPNSSYVDMDDNLNYTIPDELFLPYTNYTFDVSTATKAGSCSVVSEEQKPSPPVELESVSEEAYSIGLSWSPPLKVNGNLSQYAVLVQQSRNSSDSFPVFVGGNETFTDVDSLDECTHYIFSVVAINGAGHSAPSESVEGTTTSDDTNNSSISVFCQIDDGNFEVSWHEASIGCEAPLYTVNYTVTVQWDDRKFTKSKTTMNTSFELPQEDYIPGSRYEFIVTAGVHLGNCSNVTPEEQSKAPTLSVPNVEPNKMTLEWDPPIEANGVIQYYAINWKDDAGQLWNTNSTKDETTYEITEGVIGCTYYTVSVAAYNGWGLGVADTVYHMSGVAGPSQAQCFSESSDSVEISWVAAPGNCGSNGTFLSWWGTALWDDSISESGSQVIKNTENSAELMNMVPYSQYNVCIALPGDNSSMSCCGAETDEDKPTQPEEFDVTTSSSSSISLSWQSPEYWNGLPQGYILSYLETDIEIKANTTGYVLLNLPEDTEFNISLSACSEGGGCGDQAKLVESTQEVNTNGSNVGLIVGSVLGSLVLLAIVALGVRYYIRRRGKEENHNEKTPSISNSEDIYGTSNNYADNIKLGTFSSHL